MSVNKLVSEVITESGIDPELLELELTETGYIEINAEVIRELKQLKNAGIQLTIDHFWRRLFWYWLPKKSAYEQIKN